MKYYAILDTKRKIVIRMLEAGLPEDSILVATGLTSEEVDQIRKESMQKK